MRKLLVNEKVESVVSKLVLSDLDLKYNTIKDLKETAYELKYKHMDLLSREDAKVLYLEALKSQGKLFNDNKKFIVKVDYEVRNYKGYYSELTLEDYYILKDDLSLELVKSYDEKGLYQSDDKYEDELCDLDNYNLALSFIVEHEDINGKNSFLQSNYSGQEDFDVLEVKVNPKRRYVEMSDDETEPIFVKSCKYSLFNDSSKYTFDLNVFNLPVYKSDDLKLITQMPIISTFNQELINFEGSISEIRELLSKPNSIVFGKADIDVLFSDRSTINFKDMFLYSSKHKVRAISRDRVYNVNQMPLRLIEAFSLNDDKTYDSISINAEGFDVEGVFDLYKVVETENAESVILRRGAHRHTPVGISNAELYQIASKEFREAFRSHKGLSVFAGDIKSLDGVSLDNDDSFERGCLVFGGNSYYYLNSFKTKCPNCSHDNYYDAYDEYPSDDRYIATLYSPDSVRCNECGHVIIPGAEKFRPERQFERTYAYLDADEAGKMILRLIKFNYYNSGSTKSVDVEFRRAIYFSKNHSTVSEYYKYGVSYDIDNLYELDNFVDDFENYDNVESLAHLSSSYDSEQEYFNIELLPYLKTNSYDLLDLKNIVMIQSRDEFIDVLSKNKTYKYSAIDRVFYDGVLNARLELLNKYIMLYKLAPSIEFIMKVDETEDILEYILSYISEGNLSEGVIPSDMSSQFNFSANDIKTFLGISNRQYNLYMQTDNKLEDLKEVKRFKTSEDYWLYKENDFHPYTAHSRYGNDLNENGRENLSLYLVDEVYHIAEAYGKKFKSIFEYILSVDTNQACGPNNSITLFRDYLNMATKLEYDLSKTDIFYPNSLIREHDVAVRRYNDIKDEIKMKRLKDKNNESIKKHKKYEFKGDVYSVIAPEALIDISNEGKALNHCVASYVDRVDAGRTNIMFLRRTDKLESPMYTIEISGGSIVQLRGKYNESLQGEAGISVFVDVYKDYVSEVSKEDDEDKINKIRDKYLGKIKEYNESLNVIA